MSEDILWEQRYANFRKALDKLTKAVEMGRKNLQSPESDSMEEDLKEVLKEGLIHRFEYTHELAWNVMKDYAFYQGNSTIKGSRDATREAFKMGLISHGETWMDMLQSRNLSSHTYNENTAQEIFNKIINLYHPLLKEFEETIESIRTGKQGDLFNT